MSLLPFIASSRRRNPFGDTTTFITHDPGSNIPKYLYTNAGGTTPATADGDIIASWKTTAGTVVAVSGGPTLRFVSGVPVVRFDGVNDRIYLTGSFPLTNRYLALKYSLDSTEADVATGLISVCAGGADQDFLAPDGFAITGGSIVPPSTAINKNTGSIRQILSVRADPTNWYQYLNGVLVDTKANTSLGTAAKMSIGCRLINGAVSNPHTAMDVEAFVYANAPSPGKIAAIETALGVNTSRPPLVCVGDSLTHGFYGFASTVASTLTYPGQLQTLRPGYTVVNDGSYGQQISSMDNRVAITNAMYQLGGKLVFLGGTNNLQALNTTASVLSQIAALVAKYDAVWGASNVFVGTIPDRQDIGASQSTYDANRLAVNASIRTTYAGRLVDFAINPLIGDVGAANNTTYFNVDKVHFTPTGHGINAAAVHAAVP